MRLKLDENLDIRWAEWLSSEGFDTDTVIGEHLSGADDEAVYAASRAASRTLVTLDLDFANPLRFPPGPTEGIVVLRPPRPVLSLIRAVLAGVLPELKTRSPRGSLWIAEPGRIRVYEGTSIKG